MKQYTYLALLLFSISGLAMLDLRYHLAFWRNRRAASLTIGSGVLLFLLWDILGIGLGIFLHGNSPYSLPLRLFPEFPIEELFFLFLLCYVTLLLYTGGVKIWQRTSS